MTPDGVAASRSVLLDPPRTCDGARRLLIRLSAQGRVGEVQAVRDWLAANGKSVATYAQQARQMAERRDEGAPADAASATASAVAASAAPVAAAVASAAASSVAVTHAGF
jgi:hypothetical protein